MPITCAEDRTSGFQRLKRRLTKFPGSAVGAKLLADLFCVSDKDELVLLVGALCDSGMLKAPPGANEGPYPKALYLGCPIKELGGRSVRAERLLLGNASLPGQGGGLFDDDLSKLNAALTSNGYLEEHPSEFVAWERELRAASGIFDVSPSVSPPVPIAEFLSLARDDVRLCERLMDPQPWAGTTFRQLLVSCGAVGEGRDDSQDAERAVPPATRKKGKRKKITRAMREVDGPPAIASTRGDVAPERVALAPDQLDLLRTISIIVWCPSCFSAFPVADIRWSGSRGTCPTCGASLAGERYDRAWRRLSHEVSTMRHGVELLQRRVERAHAVSGHLGNGQLAKRVDALLAGDSGTLAASLGGAIHTNELVLARLPQSRYYASEWFHLTGRPLDSRGCYGASGAELLPTYTHKGDFTLRFATSGGRGASSSGAYAEWLVFEELGKAARRTGGPLHGARVCPNLFVPQVSTRAGMPSFAQVDLVLLTRRCAYAIEVKWRSHAVRVTSQGVAMVDDKPDEYSRDPLGQCDYHAHCVDAVISGEYPQAVGRVCVYVGCTSFAAANQGVFDRGFIGCLSNDASSFVEALERREEQLSREGKAIPQDRVDDVADRLNALYGDVSGTKAEMHVRELERLHGQ